MSRGLELVAFAVVVMAAAGAIAAVGGLAYLARRSSVGDEEIHDWRLSDRSWRNLG